MKPLRLHLLFLALMASALFFYAGAAQADETCPIGQSWNQGSGSCQTIVCPTGTLMNAEYGCDPIICPTGTKLEGNMCNTITCYPGYKLDPDSNSCVQVVCPSGSRLMGSECEPIVCPEGHRLNASGTDCEQFTCGSDEKISGNGCERLNCAYGYRANNGFCEQVMCSQGERLNAAGNGCELIVCSQGEQLNAAGNGCEPMTCPKGQQLNGSMCEPIICTSGTRLNSDGICESFSCDPGTRLSVDGTTCEPFTCGYGERVQDNQCVPFGCPAGEKFNENGTDCVALQCEAWETFGGNGGNECVAQGCAYGERRNATTHECEAFTCPAGQYASGETCLPLNCPPGQKVQGNSCVAAPACPAGSVYFKDGCKETSCANQRNMFDGSFNGTCETLSCPEGEVLNNGACQPVVAPPVCDAGTRLNAEGNCEAFTCPAGQYIRGNSCADLTCGANQKIVGNSCVDVPTCSAGEQLDETTNTCVSVCNAGYEKVGGICVAQCSSGYERVNGMCTRVCDTNYQERINGMCTLKCGANEERINGICTLKCDTNYQERINGMCVNQCNSTDGVCGTTCPAGKVLSGTSCVSTCPSGQENVNGICTYQCSSSQERVNGMCVYKCSAYEERVDGICTSKCTAYEERIGGVCTSKCASYEERVGTQCLAKCATGQVRSNGQCVASCPSGQTSVNGVCTTPITCPSGQNLVNGVCTTPTTPTTCPAGQYLSDNSCVSSCPAGQYLFGNTCSSFVCPPNEKVVLTGWAGFPSCERCPIGYEGQGTQCVKRVASCKNNKAGSCYTTPAESIPEQMTNDNTDTLEVQMNSLGLYYVRREGYDGSTYTRDSTGRVTGKTGSEIVAVVDSGIGGSVRSNAVIGGVTCVNGRCDQGDGSPNIGAIQWDHGTYTASQISGSIISAAPGAKLLAVNATSYLDPNDSHIENLAAGVIWSVNQGARIINFSNGVGPGISTTTGKPCIGGGYGCTWSFQNVPDQYKDYLINAFTPAMNALAASRSVLVVSAGNSAYSQPTMYGAYPLLNSGWKYNIITAASVDVDKVFNYDGTINKNPGLSIFKNYDGTNSSWGGSNACGSAAAWCMVAPGNMVLAEDHNGIIVYSQGTSMAAPQISSALAMLTGAFPQLSAVQAAQILFKTATDLGAPGLDATYGWGLLNFERAFNPSDSNWVIPTIAGGSNVNGTLGNGTISTGDINAMMAALNQAASSYNSMDFNSSYLNLAAPFGAALRNSNLSLMFFDEYYKNYSVPLSSLVRNVTDSGDMESRMELMARNGAAFDQAQNFGFMTVALSLGAQDSANIASMAPGTTITPSLTESGNTTSTIAKGMVQFDTKAIGGAINGAVGYKASPADIFTATAFGEMNQFNAVMADTLRNPYMALTQQSTAVGLGYKRGTVGFKAGAYSGTLSANPENLSRPDKVTGAMAEVTVGNPNHHAVSFTAGTMKEESTLLSAQSSGALSIGDGAVTNYGSVSGKVALTDKVSFLATYNMGLTQAGMRRNSLVQSVSDIVTDSFSVGLAMNDLIRDNDSFQLSLSQPLRVRSAKASLSLPTSIDADGVVGFSNENVSLASAGRELDIDGYYTTALDSESDLKIGSTIRFQPGHDAAAEAEMITMARYSLRF